MNKNEFTRYINEMLSGLSLERQIEELQKVQEKYLPELIQSRQKKLGTFVPQEKKQDYIFCQNCKKYSLKKEWKETNIKEVRTETTFIDAGYGDDDMMGDVEYMVTYMKCPRCGHMHEQKKLYMKTLIEWKRRDGRRREI